MHQNSGIKLADGEQIRKESGWWSFWLLVELRGVFGIWSLRRSIVSSS
jgi:hypothetical protein